MALMVALALGAAALTGCGASPMPIGPRGTDGLTIPTPSPDPADFGGRTSNRWFPLEPGTRWTYRRYTVTGEGVVVATVLPGAYRVDGIATTAVRWQVRERGVTRTAMTRWYAVDAHGNVWWFGQHVSPHEPPLDRLAPRSWRAGRSGAEAGLLLTRSPRVGDGYFNAEQRGVVARRSTVVSLRATVVTPRHRFHDTVETHDLSTLAPLHSVQTYYAAGIGMVGQVDSTSTSTQLSLIRVRRS